MIRGNDRASSCRARATCFDAALLYIYAYSLKLNRYISSLLGKLEVFFPPFLANSTLRKFVVKMLKINVAMQITLAMGILNQKYYIRREDGWMDDQSCGTSSVQ